VLHKFCAVSDPIGPADPDDHVHEEPRAMLGAALLITQFGSGAWSLDSRKH